MQLLQRKGQILFWSEQLQFTLDLSFRGENSPEDFTCSMPVNCSFFIMLVKYFLKCITLIFFGLKWATFILVVQGPKICLVHSVNLKHCPSSLGSHQTQVTDAGRTPKMFFFPSFLCTIRKISFKIFLFPSILAIVFLSYIFSLISSW